MLSSQVLRLTISLMRLMPLIAPSRAVTTPLKTLSILIRMAVDTKVRGHLLNVPPQIALLTVVKVLRHVEPLLLQMSSRLRMGITKLILHHSTLHDSVLSTPSLV